MKLTIKKAQKGYEILVDSKVVAKASSMADAVKKRDKIAEERK